MTAVQGPPITRVPYLTSTPQQRQEWEDAATPSREAQVLQHAASLLVTEGWCQDVSHDNRGRVCLTMAVVLAVDEVFPDFPPAVASHLYFDVVGLISETLLTRDGYEGRLEDWQDQPGMSLDDVLDLLAAARAMCGGM
jgi:hypothetical protein